MAVTPLTQEELASMPRSQGASWPRGVMLRCSGCGRTGLPASVEGHRGRTDRAACRTRPEAFRTIEEADQRSLEVEADLEVTRDSEASDAAASLLTGVAPERLTQRILNERRGKLPEKPSRTVGAGRSQDSERGSTPPRAVVHVAFDIPADIYARFDQCRRDAQFGFKGEIGDYFCAVEPAYWILIRWLEEGMPVPIAELAGVLAA